jgi:hypothetical protein
MPPPRKDICDCGVLTRASMEPAHPIRFDPEMNEYFISYANQGKMHIYYCPFCGGRTPKSRRESLFEFISDKEQTRIGRLFKGIKTERDVKKRFGTPDRDREIGAFVIHPEKGFKASRGEAFRTLTYINLSPVAEVTFEIGTDGRARGGWSAKPKGRINVRKAGK